MEIIVLAVLTLMNGFFALSEIALVSVKRQRIERQQQLGDRRAKMVLDLLRNPEQFLSSVQVGITLIGVVSGAYGGATLADDFQPLLARIPILEPYSETLAFVIIVGIITYFSIVVGELIPKTIALSNSEKVALTVAPIIRIFSNITLPLVRFFSGSTNLIIRLLNIKDADEERMTEEELQYLILVAGKQGVLEKQESEVYQNLFQFADQQAKTLKTYRTDVIWLDTNDSLEENARIIRQTGHSKFPVCEGIVDKVKGVITAKDFWEHQDHPDFTLESIMREPLFIPENMYAFDILQYFKRQKQYLGLVVDEYGSFEGVITLHDLTEAIVGDLPDRDTTDEPELLQREDHSFLVNGSILVQDLNHKLGTNLIPRKPNSYSTLAGFIIHHLNRIPKTGFKFQYADYQFDIIDLDGSRIDKIILTKMPEEQLEEASFTRK